MKYKYLLITVNTLEFTCDNNGIIDSSLRSERDNKDGKHEPSGIVFLCLYILDDQRYNKGRNGEDSTMKWWNRVKAIWSKVM